jgi:uncharacterized cupin superfamily protein
MRANIARMHAFNIHDAEFTCDGNEPDGFLSGEALGLRELGTALTVRLFEAPPGQALCPYHYEYEEEWLLVVDGAPSLRDPDGERQLKRGDIVCFPVGPDGVHQVINRTEDHAHVMMWSSAREPSVAVYPDSDKIGIYTPDERDALMVRRRDGSVDYWDGEPAPR